MLRNDEVLIGLLTTVKEFSDDIGMDFDLEKCGEATFARGQLKQTDFIKLDTVANIKELNPQGSYRFRGIHEGIGVHQAIMKGKIRKHYCKRIRLILNN